MLELGQLACTGQGSAPPGGATSRPDPLFSCSSTTGRVTGLISLENDERSPSPVTNGLNPEGERLRHCTDLAGWTRKRPLVVGATYFFDFDFFDFFDFFER